MRLYFWLVSFFLAMALLYYILICSLPPWGDEVKEHWAYAKQVAVGGGIVGALAMAWAIGWLWVRRELPK